MRATIVETDAPGLFDIATEDGRTFEGLTAGQVADVIAREGLIPA